MKSFLKFIVPIILVVPFLNECASPISVSGGPKDTIPPTLLESNPEMQAINFSERIIQLTFDEFVTADALKQNLIITPSTENKYVVQVKKNNVFLKFEEDFEDSTTYTFNFFKGITDITEKSPAENLVLPFSTGPIIDSLIVSGSINDLLTQAPEEGMTVGLYTLHDSLDYTKEKPRYFINTNEQGYFEITNIKADDYRLFSFKDENSNLLFDPGTEKHAFVADTIHLLTNYDTVKLNTILLDITEPQLLTGRPGGKYFEVRYNKALTSYQAQTSDSLYQLYSRINADHTSIRFYPQTQYPDSLAVYLSATDTLQQLAQDTVFIKFNESSKKPEKFNLTTSPKPNATFGDSINIKIAFNKPVTSIDLDSLLIKGDTLLTIPLKMYNPDVRWNHDKTKLDISYLFNWTQYSDSVAHIINQSRPDSVTQITEVNKFTFHAAKGSFISIEKDSSSIIDNNYSVIKEIETGSINYSVQLEDPSFFVELIDKKYKVIDSKRNEASGIFSKVPPGQYSLRVLIDSNNDGKWTYGNFNQGIEPEPVKLYPGFTELRAKWDITIDNFVIDNLLITE